MKAWRWIATMLVVAAPLAGTTQATAARVVVFAAASLTGALDEQARRFEAATGNRVVISYAASSALARQIEAGAPADVFISADLDWMDYLDARRLLAPGTQVDLLRNALVLVAPSTSRTSLAIAPGFPLAQALGRDKLAMANPESVPAGKYGKRALESLGIWASVEGKVARAENVRVALALVSRGEAAFGIVYASDAVADRGVRVVGSFPPASHPPIVYPAAVLAASASPAARPFLAYLRSPPANVVWEVWGFGGAP